VVQQVDLIQTYALKQIAPRMRSQTSQIKRREAVAIVATVLTSFVTGLSTKGKVFGWVGRQDSILRVRIETRPARLEFEA
jgi:hypothetical protein